MKAPLLPFSLDLAKRKAKIFEFMSNTLINLFPALDENLVKAGIRLSGVEYLSIAIFASLLYFFAIFIFLIAVALYMQKLTIYLAIRYLFLGLIVGFATFVYYAALPSVRARKRAEMMERELVFALRDMTIQIKSGVPFFDALVFIAESNYGPVSEEFKKVVKEVSSGLSEEEALARLVKRTESFYLKQVAWQVISALRTGRSVGDTLESLLSDLIADQNTKVRRFGQELNLWGVIYMIFGVVIPTIGVVFLALLSLYGALAVTSSTLTLLIIYFLAFQIIFFTSIRSRIPVLLAGR